GTVYVDGQMGGDVASHDQLVQAVDQFLGTAHRKGRHDDGAAALGSGIDYIAQGLPHLAFRLMFAVAVGAFDEQDIRFADDTGVAEDGAVRPAEIATEHQADDPAGFLVHNIQGHDSRAENMTGIVEGEGDAWHDFARP